MSLHRTRASHFDVLDHMLDKGIVFDAWMQLSAGCVDLMSVDAHVVVASIETCLKHPDARGVPSGDAKSVDERAAPISRTDGAG
jgi:gas vesicle structural protein